jgi:hypothetical protein
MLLWLSKKELFCGWVFSSLGGVSWWGCFRVLLRLVAFRVLVMLASMTLASLIVSGCSISLFFSPSLTSQTR